MGPGDRTRFARSLTLGLAGVWGIALWQGATLPEGALTITHDPHEDTDPRAPGCGETRGRWPCPSAHAHPTPRLSGPGLGRQQGTKVRSLRSMRW